MNERNLLFLGYFVTVFILAFIMYRTVDLKSDHKRLENAAFIYSVSMMVLSVIGFVVTVISMLLGLFVR